MKKINFLIWFLTTLLCSSLSAQKNDSAGVFGGNMNPSINEKEEKPNNLIGIDIHLTGFSFQYSRRVKDDFFLGGELGFLPDKLEWVLLASRHFTEENTIWSDDRSQAHLHLLNQLFFLHLFTKWKPSNSNFFELDAGLRFASYKNLLPSVDYYGFPNFYGLYIKPSFGYKQLKLGIHLGLGYMFQNERENVSEFTILANPFIRFNFNF